MKAEPSAGCGRAKSHALHSGAFCINKKIWANISHTMEGFQLAGFIVVVVLSTSGTKSLALART